MGKNPETLGPGGKPIGRPGNQIDWAGQWNLGTQPHGKKERLGNWGNWRNNSPKMGPCKRVGELEELTLALWKGCQNLVNWGPQLWPRNWFKLNWKLAFLG